MANDSTSIADFYKALKHSPFVMIGLDDTPDHAEPMTAQIEDGVHDTLWFFTSRDNRVAIGGGAMAQFSSKGHDFFACLHGTLSVNANPAMIDTLWSKQVESWFPGGKTDPNLLLMHFAIDSAEMWQADLSLTGMVKMMFGGKISPDEVGDHAKLTLHPA
ncbi:pyridoxamine 5'-phosphate oxidase family protein [Sphingomonas sp. 28-63-12]|uniref:pyridoxamine 5'-phosphate oxidase family protein n=1 Tax=Sphingomonas sp. 28-63-12 TaxID=1970434 RepID=UPI000BD27EB6|nr:MAG: general stress protein [Sphingomonas sp. 28-63-12]